MTEKNEDHPKVAVLPPLVFLSYLVSALIVNWAFPFPTPWTLALRIVGGAMVLLGFWLTGAAISHMRQKGTSPDPHQPTTALVTEGPYRWTRNPIYLGFFSIYLGFTLLAGTLWGILMSPFLLWTITNSVIHAEEVYLEKKFEDMYAGYRSRVRRWL